MAPFRFWLASGVLRPFIQDRKKNDGVANSTVNRALEIVRRILYLARDDWGWITRVPKIRMLKEPKRRIRFLTDQEAGVGIAGASRTRGAICLGNWMQDAGSPADGMESCRF